MQPSVPTTDFSYVLDYQGSLQSYISQRLVCVRAYVRVHARMCARVEVSVCACVGERIRKEL